MPPPCHCNVQIVKPLHGTTSCPRYPQGRTCHAGGQPTSRADTRRDRKCREDKGFHGLFARMSAPLKSIEGSSDIAAAMGEIGRRARAAARALALAPVAQKNRALGAMAAAVRGQPSLILAANAEDVAEARAAGGTGAFLEHLALDPARIDAIAAGIEAVRGLKDPVGTVMESWTRPNGMRIERWRVPLGVIGIIYESRPNVTADAGVLSLKSGNAAILRGGSDSMRSSRAILTALAEGLRASLSIVTALAEGLRATNLPEAAIQLVPTRDRAAVGLMLSGLDGNVDVI